MLKFSECTLIQLDKTFGLKQVEESQVLQSWLKSHVELSTVEQQMLSMYRETLIRYADNWNEIELIQHFIGPLFTLVNFSNKSFSLFAERPFQGNVNGIEMAGEPDGLIASGWREPEKPYFCFQEYKKERDPRGDPAGQALAAMLVAQEVNEHRHPIYGCYIIGRNWFFMTLEEKDYSISNQYVATRDDIFDIFRILKGLKQIIAQLIANE